MPPCLCPRDYRITDPHSDPSRAKAFYIERLLRLPDCAWPYKPSSDGPEAGPLPALAAGHITFGCLNKPAKITIEAAALWERILSAVPGSRLVVLSAAGSRGLLEKFKRCGIPPGRVELSPPRPRTKYLELFNRIDIAVDPFPYNGDTTTCDGLWMGVPLVTLAGDVFVSRRGVCYLRAVGWRNWSPKAVMSMWPRPCNWLVTGIAWQEFAPHCEGGCDTRLLPMALSIAQVLRRRSPRFGIRQAIHTSGNFVDQRLEKKSD